MAARISTSGNTYNFKIVLLGEGCVGKTSCVLRYVEDAFNDKHLTTLQASFLTKKTKHQGQKSNFKYMGYSWSRKVPCLRAYILQRRRRSCSSL